MAIELIVAMDEKGGIGIDGKLPWDLPDDLKRFKRLTMGKCVLMGRKTYESLPVKLEGREVIVLTNNRNYKPKDDNVTVVAAMGDGFKYAKSVGKDLIVAGGRDVYVEVLPFVSIIYLTLVWGVFKVDTCFPIDPSTLLGMAKRYTPSTVLFTDVSYIKAVMR